MFFWRWRMTAGWEGSERASNGNALKGAPLTLEKGAAGNLGKASRDKVLHPGRKSTAGQWRTGCVGSRARDKELQVLVGRKVEKIQECVLAPTREEQEPGLGEQRHGQGPEESDRPPLLGAHFRPHLKHCSGEP